MAGVLPVKMLGVLAVVLLACDLNEGRIVSKCELRSQLQAAQFQVLPENLTVDDLIARLVCRANSSGFNTHFVKFVTTKHENQTLKTLFQVPPLVPPQGPSSGPPLSQPPSTPHSQLQGLSQDKPKGPSQGKPQNPSLGQGQPKPQHPAQPQPQHPAHSEAESQPQRPIQSQVEPQPQRPAQSQAEPQGKGQAQPRRPPKDPNQKSRRSAPKEVAVFHRYGVFQLSDKEACDSEIVPTLNVCQMNCSALVDEDLSDDIICLTTMSRTMLDSLLVSECQNVDPSKYFAECH